MKKIIVLLFVLYFSQNSFAQLKAIERIGSTTLRDSSNQLTIDKNTRILKNFSVLEDLTVTGSALFQSNVVSNGIGSFTSLNAASYYINDENLKDVFGTLTGENYWSRTQNFDTLNSASTFNLNIGGTTLFQVTNDGSWMADHYDFYSKGVKRVSIDNDSNKIKIYSGADQISLWNNNGMLDINAPVVSHGGFITEGMTVKTKLNITGTLSYTPVTVANDTLHADSATIFTKTLSANTAFKISGISDGQTITFAVTNTAGNYTASWSSLDGLSIYWPGNSAPVQTTGAHVDVYTFRRIGSDIYGSVVQNYK
ncbi:MAG: hypothetical protein K1X86_12575 [Ignavibacteria bacterium]|nr:hypothetical protein [Ignavibacteria bacterium]